MQDWPSDAVQPHRQQYMPHEMSESKLPRLPTMTERRASAKAATEPDDLADCARAIAACSLHGDQQDMAGQVALEREKRSPRKASCECGCIVWLDVIVLPC